MLDRFSGRAKLVGLRAALAGANAGLAALVADGAIGALDLSFAATAGVSVASASLDVVKQASEHWAGIVDALLRKARRGDEEAVEAVGNGGVQ